MKQLLLLASFIFLTFSTFAQGVGIGTASPDNSAMLDITSVDKGVLVPRMSSTARQAIIDPAIGLMVYDSTTKAFYYFTGNGWLELLAGSVDKIVDADGDTKIHVEASPDEDTIRFDIAGTEHFKMSAGGRLEVYGNGGSVFLGENAGENDDLSNNSNVFIGKNSGQSNTSGSHNTAIGNNTLMLNTTGYSNNAFGSGSLASLTTGSANVGIGNASLEHTTDGQYNIGIGWVAGAKNQGGDRNVFLGAFAGNGLNFHNKNNNVMIGYNAGSKNEGSNNIFLGYHAGFNETGNHKLYIENSASNSPLIYGEFDNNLLRINGTLNINNAFSFPTTDGTINQVLKTDGAGNLTWQADNGSATTVLDTDGDTKIQVEESADEDIIRFDLAGAEKFVFDGPHIHVKGSGSSTFLGEDAGLNDDLVNNSNTLIGKNAGRDNITGTNNVAIGTDAQVSNIASFNTAIGWKAMEHGTTSHNSTAIGSTALRDNVSGENNVAIGSGALVTDSTGSNNVAVGRSAGFSTQGSGNVFLGNFAGKNEPGSNKLYIDNNATSDPLIYGDFGTNLLRINGTLNVNNAFSFPLTDGATHQVLKTDGAGNVSWQEDKGNGNIQDTDGDTKIQVEENSDEDIIRFDVGGTEQLRILNNSNGAPLLHVNSVGGNLYLGANNGRLDTGFVNTFLGQLAGEDHASGNHNTFIGGDAGRQHTSGSNNIFVGARAGFTNTNGSGNVFLGKSAGSAELGSNRLYIANSGTSFPLIYGEFDNDLVRIHGTLNVNNEFSFPVSDGAPNQILRTDGSGNLSWTADIDTDTDDQTLSLSGNDLSISEGNTVDLSSIDTDTDDQTLSLSGNDLSISEGNTVDLSVIDTDTDDQTLSLSGNDLSISDGNTVDLSSIDTDTDNQVIDTLQLNGSMLEISLEDDGLPKQIVDLSAIDTDTDDQTLSLSGSDLSISEGNTVDLSSIDTDTDDQTLSLSGNDLSISEGNTVDLSSIDTDDQTLTLSGNDLSISEGNTIDLSSIDTDTDDQTLSLSGNDLSISEGNTVDLSVIDTDTDDQTLSLSGTDLSISEGNTVDLSVIDTDTDDQIIDVLQMNGDTLEISLQDDGLPIQKLDLSGINTVQPVIEDADGDTKIQAEEGADEDVIRFDIGGTEYFKMEDGRLHVLNTGNSVFMGEGAGANDDLSTNHSVFIGSQAGHANTTGLSNTAIGSQALETNTTGYSNSALGHFALRSNTNGFSNSAFGYKAMDENTTGRYNVASGGLAMTRNSTGEKNVGYGYRAGHYNQSGSNNVFIGFGAGEGSNFHSKSNNVMVGLNSGGNSTGSGNVFLGYASGENESASNRLYIDNSNSSSPLIYGQFDNDLLRFNGDVEVEGSLQIADGTQSSGYILTSDANGNAQWTDPTTVTTSNDGDWTISGDNVYNSNTGNVGIGSVTPGSKLTVANSGANPTIEIQKDDDTHQANLSFSGGATQYQLGTPTSDRLRFWTSGVGEVMSILSNGNIGVRTTSPLANFHVNGSIRANSMVIADTTRSAFILKTDDNAADMGLAYRNNGGNFTWNIYRSDAGSNAAHLVIAGGPQQTDISNLPERMRITSTGSVGFGTPTPQAPMHVQAIGTGFTWTPFAQTSAILERNGGSLLSLVTNPGGITSVVMGDTDSQFSGRIRYEHTDDRLEFWTTNVERMAILNNGNVGIGTDTVTVKFQVGKSGDGTVARANAWNIYSDRRWKTDLALITDAIDKIEAINGYYYKWLDRPDTTTQVGVIAQEIETVLPEVVTTDSDGYKSVDYSKLTALLIQGMKEQQEQIDALTQQVHRLDELEAKVNLLLEK